MKIVFRYAKPYAALLVVIVIFKLTGAILDLMIPSTIADILDVGVPSGKVSVIVNYGLRMLGFAAAEMVINISANWMSSRVSARLVQRLRQDLFNRTMYLSARQMRDLTPSSAISRLTSDTYNVTTMLNRVMRVGMRAPFLMLGGLVITFREDPVLTLILVVSMPLVVLTMFHISRKVVPLHKQKQTILDRMIRTVQENVSGIRVIKALSKTEYEKGRYEKVNNELAEKGLSAGLMASRSQPTLSVILGLAQVGVIVLGALRIHAGAMTPGKIVAFLSYFTIIFNATTSINGVFVTCTNGAASAQRISEIMALPPTHELLDIPAGETEYAIEFRDVCFSYNKVENNIKHVSFRLKKGQTLGIIGSTGSGKSTVLKLLMREYDTDSGSVLINGRDVRSIPNEELRAMFGVALQNDFLVADTIENNIDFYRDLPEESRRKAAVLAQAADFIAEKEGGMDYVLSVKGNNLSGGQKQRLLIARAIAAQPEILVLDDASSALDYRTDALLRKALAEELAGTTKVIVAQRVSSIRSADVILVLDGADVIGQGTHDELMQSCEDYQIIAHVQMETEDQEVPVHG